MADRIQQRRDTAARWAQFNPILLEGEVGYVTDDPNQYKIGDGVHAWNELPLRGFDGTLVHELGDSQTAAMSQQGVTDAIRKYSGGFPYKSAASTVEDFAKGIVSCKILPKFTLAIEGISDFRVVLYGHYNDKYILSGGFYQNNGWYKTISLFANEEDIIDGKYLLFRNTPNDDWGQCYLLADVTNFPSVASGSYPAIAFYTEEVCSPYHPYLDFAIRDLLDRPDIDSLLEGVNTLNGLSYLIEVSKTPKKGISFYDSEYAKVYGGNDTAGYCSYVPVKKGDVVEVIVTPFIKYDETLDFPDTTFVQVFFSKTIVNPTTEGVTSIVAKRNITADDYKYGQVVLSLENSFTVEEDGYIEAFILVGDIHSREGNAALMHLNFGKTEANVDGNSIRWYRQSSSPTDPNYPRWSLFSGGTLYDLQYQIPLVLGKKSFMLSNLFNNRNGIKENKNSIAEIASYLSRNFVVLSAEKIKPFTDTVIEVYAVAKFDTSGTNGMLRMNGWTESQNISAGVLDSTTSEWHTISIQKTTIKIGGLTLWYGDNSYFTVALLGDESKWVTPDTGTYPSFQVRLSEVGKPVHPTIWPALNMKEIADLENSVVKEIADYLTTPNYGYLPDSKYARFYRGDNCGLCQYVKLSNAIKLSKITTQFYKTGTLISGIKLMVGVFDNLTNPTLYGDLFTIVNRDLTDADFNNNNNIVIDVDDIDIESGKYLQVVVFTGEKSTVGSGVQMKYLNFGNAEPEYLDDLENCDWYRQSSGPTEEIPIPRAWGIFPNSGKFAYQYQIPLELKSSSTYSKLIDKVREIDNSYLPKSLTKQQAEDNEVYGSYYDSSHWVMLKDNGCRVLYAIARKDFSFQRIYTTLCCPSDVNSNKTCKLRVYALNRQVVTADLRSDTGFLYEKEINPYTDLPTQRTFYVVDLPEEVSVKNGDYVSVVLFDPDDTLESGIASISSWVYRGDEENHETLQLVYRCSRYDYETQSFSLGYFTYGSMVTYQNYIGNIEPIFSCSIGESGETLRRDIGLNKERIENLEERVVSTNFYSRSVLPSVLHAAVGLEFNLYYDGFNLLPDYGKGEPGFMFNIQSEIESKWKALNYRSYQRTMKPEDIGDHTLTIDYYNNRNQKFSTETPDERFTVGLKVVNSINPMTQKRILIIGDSTNENGNVANRIYKNFHEVATAGIAPIMLGTRCDASKTWRHEARTEKTYSMFANGETVIRVDFNVPEEFTEDDIATANPSPYYNIGGANVYLRHLWHLNGDGTGYAIGYNNSSVDTSWTGTATKTGGAASMPSSIEVTRVQRLSGWSPFKNNEGVGTLDFGYYRTVILGLQDDEKIDLMLSDLGINDIYTGVKNQEDITNIVNNAKKLIDAYLADGNGKFAVCYPKSRSSAIADSDRRHYPMRIDMQSLREALIDTFDNGKYNENVLICGSGMQIDRWYGYPLTAANVASRITIQETKPTEGVHPSDAGYQQIGDAMTATIWAVLND